MKIKLLLFVLTVFSIKSNAQEIQLLSNFTNESFRFTSIIEKDINSKWNYFSLTEVGSLYESTDKIQFETNQFVNCKLKNNFALTAGMSIGNDNILPQVGISYSKENQKWSFAFYPTINYGIADKQWGSSLNSVMEFSPTINQKWDFYTLALLDFDYNFGNVLSSQQFINIGFQYNKKIQFGVNIDFEQEDNFKNTDTEYGIFLGVNL